MAHVAFALGAWACSPDEAKQADTAKVIYEEDINARDTTPTPPPSPIGRMQLLAGGLPPGGTCNVTRYRPNFELAATVTYETLTPPRQATLEVGKPPRLFAPVSLQIVGTQNGVTLREQETIFVGFSQQGTVNVGSRTYSATGATTANERTTLGVTDAAEALAYARAMMEECRLSG